MPLLLPTHEQLPIQSTGPTWLNNFPQLDTPGFDRDQTTPVASGAGAAATPFEEPCFSCLV